MSRTPLSLAVQGCQCYINPKFPETLGFNSLPTFNNIPVQTLASKLHGQSRHQLPPALHDDRPYAILPVLISITESTALSYHGKGRHSKPFTVHLSFISLLNARMNAK